MEICKYLKQATAKLILTGQIFIFLDKNINKILS